MLLTPFDDLRWKFSTAKFAKTRAMPKALTEKGLYMPATILKSPQAAQTTIAIIDDDLFVSGSETSFEIDFAVLKFKHTIKKKKK